MKRRFISTYPWDMVINTIDGKRAHAMGRGGGGERLVRMGDVAEGGYGGGVEIGIRP